MSTTLPGPADAAIFALDGNVHPSTVIDLYRRAGDALYAGSARLVIDFSGVDRVGPQTMNLLCGALRRLHHRGAALEVVNAPPPLRRALAICAPSGVLFHPTFPTALTATASQTAADHRRRSRHDERELPA